MLLMDLPVTEWMMTPSTQRVVAGLLLMVEGGRTASVFRVRSQFGQGWTSRYQPAADEEGRNVAVPSGAPGESG